MLLSRSQITSGGEAMLRDFEDMYQEFRDLVKEMSGETSSEYATFQAGDQRTLMLRDIACSKVSPVNNYQH